MNRPKIKYNITAEVVQLGDKYRWEMQMHVEGPDDVRERVGPMFNSYNDAFVNLNWKLGENVDEMIAEVGA